MMNGLIFEHAIIVDSKGDVEISPGTVVQASDYDLLVSRFNRLKEQERLSDALRIKVDPIKYLRLRHQVEDIQKRHHR